MIELISAAKVGKKSILMYHCWKKLYQIRKMPGTCPLAAIIVMFKKILHLLYNAFAYFACFAGSAST